MFWRGVNISVIQLVCVSESMAEVAARVLAAAAEEEKKYASIHIEKPLGRVAWILSCNWYFRKIRTKVYRGIDCAFRSFFPPPSRANIYAERVVVGVDWIIVDTTKISAKIYRANVSNVLNTWYSFLHLPLELELDLGNLLAVDNNQIDNTKLLSR